MSKINAKIHEVREISSVDWEKSKLERICVTAKFVAWNKTEWRKVRQ